jgi:D-alanyl-D-alanine carboxypeptidase
MKRLLPIFILLIIVAGIAAWLLISRGDTNAPTNTPGQNSQKNQQNQQPGFDKTQYSIDDPNSIWVVANKLRPLNPKTYKPSDLIFPKVPTRVPGNESMQIRKVVGDALVAMFADAKQEKDFSLMLSSGFRSYSYQVNLYGSYVKRDGQAAADTYSARPGYSEHQTGLAADITTTSHKCELEACFGDTPEGEWLAANAYKYGFILRYPADKVSVAGYEYEPWHFRYVGKELAAEMHREGIKTLEEFFSLPAAPDYKS